MKRLSKKVKKRNIEDMDLQDINKIDHSLYVKELLRRYPELCD
jgi:hypothetical protein